MESNFDLSALALKAICPDNDLKFDNDELPSVCVYIPKCKISDLIDGASDATHPAFIVDGTEIDGFWYDKYQGVMYNSKMYSLPAQDPKVSLTYDTCYNAYKNKGTGFHMATIAERAVITLWCVKNGFYPSGNTNYGKDETESIYKAVPANTDSSGNTCRTLTGTGPNSWYHNGEIDGIADVTGNVWEMHAGARLVYGEIQILENNDAANTENSNLASSSQWKAINEDGDLIEPDGSGTTSGSLKIDYLNSVATIVTGTLSGQSTTSRSCKFKNIVAGDGVTIPEILKALALFPVDGETYDEGYFYWNNGIAEAIPYAGGSYSTGASAWVGRLNFLDPRSYTNVYTGGRGAYIDL